MGDHRGAASHIPPGEAQHPEARHGQAAIAIAVGLKRPCRSVRSPAVNLDDKLRLSPEEVHDVVEQGHVDLWLGKAVFTTER